MTVRVTALLLVNTLACFADPPPVGPIVASSTGEAMGSTGDDSTTADMTGDDDTLGVTLEPDGGESTTEASTTEASTSESGDTSSSDTSSEGGESTTAHADTTG